MGENCPKYLEDEFDWKLSNCRNDLMVKLVGGFAIGFLGKILMPEKKKWPLIIAVGAAIGMASENCKRELNLTMTSCLPIRKKGKRDAEEEEDGEYN